MNTTDVRLRDDEMMRQGEFPSRNSELSLQTEVQELTVMKKSRLQV